MEAPGTGARDSEQSYRTKRRAAHVHRPVQYYGFRWWAVSPNLRGNLEDVLCTLW